MKPPHKGALLSLGAALGSAMFLMPFKQAGTMARGDVVVLAVLLVAALLNTAAACKNFERSASFDRTSVVTAVVLGLLTVSGNYAAGEALAYLGAGVTSVLQQTQVLFVTVGSWLFLREHITLRFLVGTAIVLAGLVIMRAPAVGTASLALPGVAWGFASALSFAAMQVFTRKVIHHIRPVWINAFRLWLAAAILVSLPGNAATLASLDSRVWLLCAAAACIGPFLARICLMYSLRHITASRSALITLVAPVFAFLFDYALFGRAPTTFEIIGGAVAMAGICIPILEVAGDSSQAGPT